jgi:hypothetical protein
VERVSGKYFEEKQEAESSEMSYNASAAQRLWDASLRLTKLVEDPQV